MSVSVIQQALLGKVFHSPTSRLQEAENQEGYQPSPEFDQATIRNLYGSDLEHLLNMFEMFLDRVPTEMSQVFAMAYRGRSPQLTQRLHKLKPNFELIGLPFISKLITELEMTETGFGPAWDRWAALANHYHRLLPIIRQEANRLRQVLAIPSVPSFS